MTLLPSAQRTALAFARLGKLARQVEQPRHLFSRKSGLCPACTFDEGCQHRMQRVGVVSKPSLGVGLK